MSNDIDYYKSLISDEEVIKALIKDSKERDGELPKEKTRVRPNINFFQRTVTNLMSSNKRIAKQEREKPVPREPKKVDRKIKTAREQIRETLEANKLKIGNESSSRLKENLKNYIERKRNKIRQLKQQQLKRETLEKKESNDPDISIVESESNENKIVLRDATGSCSDSDVSVVSISSADSHVSSDNDVIKLSDSDSEFSEKKETKEKGLNETSKMRKRKRKS